MTPEERKAMRERIECYLRTWPAMPAMDTREFVEHATRCLDALDVAEKRIEQLEAISDYGAYSSVICERDKRIAELEGELEEAERFIHDT